MLVAGLGDVVLHGQLDAVPRPVFAALLGVVDRLPAARLSARRAGAANCSTARRRRCRPSPAGWKHSLAAAAAANAQLNQSETRYKGLVDAQGDAIFRRAADSRLTYGNDAFFKLFGLNPQTGDRPALRAGAASRQPRAVVRQLRRPRNRARARALRPACAHGLWLALDRLGRLCGARRASAASSKCRASAATSPSARRWRTRSPRRATAPKPAAAPSRAFSPP